MFETEKRLNRMKEVISQRQRGLVVVLEDIFDPHNAAAVFRTCDAFGIQNVHLIFDQSKRFNPKKIGKSSSSSANKWIDFTTHDSAVSCLTSLKEDGYEIVATALEKDSENFYEADFTQKKIALVFGNEHRGISQNVIAHADRTVMLPMRGMVQSLNLSVTAALFIHEVTRQRIRSQKDFSLTHEEQIKLLQSFQERA